MKVLVTGASGFIGRNVLLRAPRDWEVVAVYHRAADLETFLARHDLARVTPIRCDLTSPSDAAALVQRIGAVDACIHLAANGDPTESAARPAWDLQLNTLGLVTLLERLCAAHLVYVSSGAVYDGLVGAVTPATAVVPRLPYAISKLASEHYVRGFAERRQTVGSYVNVRLFGAYGPYEPDRKITSRVVRAAMNAETEFPVRGNGDNVIDFMYVDDAADGLLTLAANPGFSGTIDFAAGSPVTVNQVVGIMARVLGISLVPVHQGHTEEYIQFYSVDRTMRERFGFAPRVALEDGVERLHRFLAAEAECGLPRRGRSGVNG